MNKFFVLISGLLLALALPVSAYYNPGPPSGYVNDFAGVLSVDQRQALEEKLVAFEAESSNELVVVTIDSLQDDTIENFAVELFADWGIGKEKNDNGVLILIAIADRQMRIEVGYGLEGALTDAQAVWIISDILRPAFRAEDYSGGLNEAVDKIIGATRGEYVPTTSDFVGSKLFEGGLLYFSLAIFATIYIFSALAHVLSRSKSYWAGGVLGLVIGAIFGLLISTLAVIGFAILLGLLGLMMDYTVSQAKPGRKRRLSSNWWLGGTGMGGGFGGGGGGFGGFGGGGSGGGGSSGGW